jgi:predicted  nucleic acid-binding Zn-ribbon protein
MDKALSVKAFQKLNDCSQAAEQLSKTIVRFAAAGERLNQSITSLTALEQRFKEDNSFQELLKASNEIKSMLDYFGKELPSFKDAVEESKLKLEMYKNDLLRTMEAIQEINSQFGNIAELTKTLFDIYDILSEFKTKSVQTEMERFKDIIKEFTADYQKAKLYFHNMNRILEDTAFEFKRSTLEMDNSIEKIEGQRLARVEGLLNNMRQQLYADLVAYIDMKFASKSRG